MVSMIVYRTELDNPDSALLFSLHSLHRIMIRNPRRREASHQYAVPPHRWGPFGLHLLTEINRRSLKKGGNARGGHQPQAARKHGSEEEDQAPRGGNRVR